MASIINNMSIFCPCAFCIHSRAQRSQRLTRIDSVVVRCSIIIFRKHLLSASNNPLKLFYFRFRHVTSSAVYITTTARPDPVRFGYFFWYIVVQWTSCVPNYLLLMLKFNYENEGELQWIKIPITKLPI